MKKFIFSLTLLWVLSLISCSTDDTTGTTTVPENLMTLKMSVTYSPQQTNFNTKTVRYYENNLIVADTTFNSLSQMTSRSTYTYDSGNRTRLYYNAANIFTEKLVHTYDNLHRLVNVSAYNAANQLTYSNVFTYQNENIFKTHTNSTGVSTLTFHFKTNADGYLNYEEDMVNGNDVRTLDYDGQKPTLLHYATGFGTAGYDYHTQAKPSNMQGNAIETNNLALSNNAMEHVHFSCNYYLKQVFFSMINLTLHRQYLFNENNYETYLKTYTEDVNGNMQNSSEVFTFYN